VATFISLSGTECGYEEGVLRPGGGNRTHVQFACTWSICGNPSVALPTAMFARNPAEMQGIERQTAESVSLHYYLHKLFSIILIVGTIAFKEGNLCVAFSDISGTKKTLPAWY
jgi:hypothetical protein